MSGVILALLERESSAAKVLAAARHAGLLMGATRINVLAVRAPSADATEAARLVTLRQIYRDWAGGPAAGNTASEWVELEGQTAKLLEEWGARAELIVLQRPGAREFDRERRPVQTALFDAGRPVLVVPQETGATEFGSCVAVAWRNDVRTERAVLAALHWLSASATVHVMVGAKRWETPPGLPPVFADHGISASFHVLPMNGQRNFGEALLARAKELNADLVLLGAFAHPMLFGPMLGGVTKHMLSRADLPVLMRY